MMDLYEQGRLEDWRRDNLTIDDIKQYIKYLKNNRKRDKKRLESMQGYVAQHYIGYDEWIDHRIVKTEQALESWNKWIAFEEWLLNQPKYVMSLP